MRARLAFIGLLLAVQAASKAEAEVYGAGAIRCEKVNSSYALDLAFIHWSQGYLTAFGYTSFEIKDLETFIIRYCYLNKNAFIADAALDSYMQRPTKQ